MSEIVLTEPGAIIEFTDINSVLELTENGSELELIEDGEIVVLESIDSSVKELVTEENQISIERVDNPRIEIISLIEQGPTGARGLSAFELAEQNGFVGTEQQWLESLKAISDVGDADFDFKAAFLARLDA